MPSPRTLPGWKSPWTSVSGRPQAASAANRAGRSATNAPSVARSRPPRPSRSRSTSAAIACERAAAAPVGQPQTEQLVGPRRPCRLEADEAVDHREPLGDRGVVAVVAGHLVEQRPRAVAPEHARDGHGPARQRVEQRALVREERRDDLEPRRAVRRSRAATGSRGSTSGPAVPARPAAGRARRGPCPPTRGRRRARRVVPRSAAAGRPGGRRPMAPGRRRPGPGRARRRRCPARRGR